MAGQTTPATRSPRRSTTKLAKTARTAKTTKTAATRTSEVVAAVIDPERRRALIAEAAFIRAERRNFVPGFEVEDWLAAESEVDTMLLTASE